MAGSNVSRNFIELEWANSADVLRAQDIPYDVLDSIKDKIDESITDTDQISADLIQHVIDYEYLRNWAFNEMMPNNLMLSGTSRLSGDIIPVSDDQIYLGNSLRHFKDVYLNNFSLLTRLNFLSGSINTNTTNIAINASNISQNTIDILQLSSDVADNDSDIAQLQTDVANLQLQGSGYMPLSGTTDLYGHIIPRDNNTYTLGQNSRRFFDVYISTYGSVKDQLSSNINSININAADIITLENSFNVLSSDVYTQINDIQTDVDSLSGDVQNLAVQVNNFAIVTGQLQTDIDTLSGQVGTNTTNITQNTNDINTLSADLISLSAQSSTAALSALEARVAVNETNISILSSDVLTNTTNISGNSVSIQNNEQDILALSSQIAASNVISGNLLPGIPDTYTIGDASGNRWNDIFLTDFESLSGWLTSISGEVYGDFYKNILDEGVLQPRQQFLNIEKYLNLNTNNSRFNLNVDRENLQMFHGNTGIELSASDYPYRYNEELETIGLRSGIYNISGDLLSGGTDAAFQLMHMVYQPEWASNHEDDLLIQLAMSNHPDLSGIIYFRQAASILDDGSVLEPEVTYSSWQNLISLSGGGTGLLTIEQNTAGVGSPNVITSLETGKVFTNEGSTAMNYHDLPAAESGLNYRFIVEDTDGMFIQSTNSNELRVGASSKSSGGSLSSNQVGSILEVIAINSDAWHCAVHAGTWTLND